MENAKSCKYCIDFFEKGGDIKSDCLMEEYIPSFPKILFQMRISAPEYLGDTTDNNVVAYFADEGGSEEKCYYTKFNYCPMCGRKLEG